MFGWRADTSGDPALAAFVATVAQHDTGTWSRGQTAPLDLRF